MSEEQAAVPGANVPLAPLTTIGVGGPATSYVRATTTREVQQAWERARELAQPLLVLGGGSNLIIADEGWAGLVLHVAITGIAADTTDPGLLTCGAGASWDEAVGFAVSRGFAGIECLSGIPGTVGGTPIQNVGAYGQEVADVIEWVDVFDRVSGRVTRMTAVQCGFGYRTSRFKNADAGRFIVCEVAFRLGRGAATVTYPDLVRFMREHAVVAPSVAEVRNAVLAIRRRKGMVLDPGDPDTKSVGSFFTNPVLSGRHFAALRDRAAAAVPSFPVRADRIKVPAAWLVEHAGFARGFGAGAVGLSTKHPLAIVNRGFASASDIVDFAVGVKRAVMERFGVELTTEPVFAGFAGDARVAYLTGGA